MKIKKIIFIVLALISCYVGVFLMSKACGYHSYFNLEQGKILTHDKLNYGEFFSGLAFVVLSIVFINKSVTNKHAYSITMLLISIFIFIFPIYYHDDFERSVNLHDKIEMYNLENKHQKSIKEIESKHGETSYLRNEVLYLEGSRIHLMPSEIGLAIIYLTSFLISLIGFSNWGLFKRAVE